MIQLKLAQSTKKLFKWPICYNQVMSFPLQLEFHLRISNDVSSSWGSISLFSSFTTWACRGPLSTSLRSFCTRSGSPWISPSTCSMSEAWSICPWKMGEWDTLPSGLFRTQPVTPYSVARFWVKALYWVRDVHQPPIPIARWKGWHTESWRLTAMIHKST